MPFIGDDIDRLRENFATESSTLIMSLDRMIERTGQLEKLIIMLGPCRIKDDSRIEVYKPSEDGDSPPKKRVRREKN